MGFFSKTGRFFGYAIIKPMEQVGDSFSQLKADYARLAEVRAQRREKVTKERQDYLDKHPDGMVGTLTPEQVSNPMLISDDHERFEVLYLMHGWTQESLSRQREALQRTKLAAAWLCVVFILAAFCLLLFAPVATLFILLPVMFLACTLSLVSAVMYAIYQMQIERRKLLRLPELLARVDLFSYIFKYKAINGSQ